MEWQIVSYFKENEKDQEKFLDYLKNIEWKAKDSLARKIQNGFFSDYQDLFILKNQREIYWFYRFS